MNFWQQLDALAAEQKPPKRGKLTSCKAALPKMLIHPEELAMAKKMQGSVTFPPGGPHKRFILSLADKSMLTDRGRQYLAYIAHRYRRQWKASAEEMKWIEKWKWTGAK